jgi:hypothetical protein
MTIFLKLESFLFDGGNEMEIVMTSKPFTKSINSELEIEEMFMW